MDVASPVAWPESLYALIAEGGRQDRLAICVAHRGAHQWYLGACCGVRPRVHARGFRFSPGQRYSYRFGRCPEDGCRVEIANRLDLQTGRVDRLDAETEEPHRHLSAPRVAIDEDRLAAAIVAASRATRVERQAEARLAAALAGPPTSTPPGEERPPPAPDAPRDIPTVTVWSPGPDDHGSTG